MDNQALLKKIEDIVGTVEDGDDIIQILLSSSNSLIVFMCEYLETMKIVKAQYVPRGKEERFIKTMLEVEADKDKAMLAIDIYNYGRIQGKREERARRNKNSHDDRLIQALQKGHKNQKVIENCGVTKPDQSFLNGLKDGLEFRLKEGQ